jgi:hypothetical protein
MKFDPYSLDQDLGAGDPASNDMYDPVNEKLNEALNSPVLTPQSGMQRIRSIVLPFGLDLDMDFKLDPDGDEIAYKFDEDYLYIIYAPNDEGYYEFYSEVTDEDGIESLLSDDLEETD